MKEQKFKLKLHIIYQFEKEQMSVGEVEQNINDAFNSLTDMKPHKFIIRQINPSMSKEIEE